MGGWGWGLIWECGKWMSKLPREVILLPYQENLRRCPVGKLEDGEAVQFGESSILTRLIRRQVQDDV